MIKMRVAAIFMTAAIALVSSGCGAAANTMGQDESMVIRVAFNQSEEHPQYKAMQELGERFKEQTDGRYEMVIYPNGVLGEQGAMAEFVRTGALQMAIVPCSVPEGYDKDFAIVGTPYLYDDMDHLRRSATTGVFDELFSSTAKYNFEVLTVYTAGERCIYAKKPIETPDDLKGLIVRVNDSSTYIKMVELMGGTGAVMSQSEVYTAIQQGVIDAAENSERVYTDFKHYEVAPYFSYTKHIVHPDVVIANVEFLNQMTTEDKAIFDDLLIESTNLEFQMFKESVQEAKLDAEAKGAKFIYPDTEPFRERCMPLLEKVSGQSEVTRGIYEKIMALKEEQ